MKSLKYVLYLLLVLGIQALPAYAQPENPLSAKHLLKITNELDPVKKRAHYLKYWNRDSLKQARDWNKYWTLKLDSGTNLRKTKRLVTKYKAFCKWDSIQQLAVSNGNNLNDAESRLAQIDTGVEWLNRSGAELNGLTPIKDDQYLEKIRNSLDNRRLQEQINSVTSDQNIQAKINEELSDLSIPNLDQLKSPQRIDLQAGLPGVSDTGLGQKELSFVESLMDSTARKEAIKKQAETQAFNYLMENPGLLQTIHKQASLLMKKYSYVPNSTDLSSAVKRTSLKGKTFKERLLVGINYQLIHLNPFSIELAPMLGYRFNSRFSVGMGATIRKSFSDTIPALTARMRGVKGFLSYDLDRSFFVYGEYSRNTSGLKSVEKMDHTSWSQHVMIGVGRRIGVSSKVDLTILALYDCFYNRKDQFYASPLTVRVGFQLSQLALMKKRSPIDYFKL